MRLTAKGTSLYQHDNKQSSTVVGNTGVRLFIFEVSNIDEK